jgi:hypothetical protein
LEVEWDGSCRQPRLERLVPVHHKTDVIGLQTFFREKFPLLANNGSCIEEVWESYEAIVFEGMELLYPIKFWVKIRIQNIIIGKLNG